jgi:hypothetical protein
MALLKSSPSQIAMPITATKSAIVPPHLICFSVIHFSPVDRERIKTEL